MGILDWFKNRPGQYDPDRASDELIQWAVIQSVTLINPRLKLLANYQRRLQPSIETTIAFLRAQVSLLPAVHSLSSEARATDPALRAFFAAPTDIPALLGNSPDNLRTLFEEISRARQRACLVLGMAFREQRTFGMALHGELVQRDVAQIQRELCGSPGAPVQP